MTRYARMRGRPTLWLPGTDHAGIATQARLLGTDVHYHVIDLSASVSAAAGMCNLLDPVRCTALMHLRHSRKGQEQPSLSIDFVVIYEAFRNVCSSVGLQ